MPCSFRGGGSEVDSFSRLGARTGGAENHRSRKTLKKKGDRAEAGVCVCV